MTENKKNKLAWIDLEMTGLNPKKDRIIEIAVIVTDDSLEEVATGPILTIHQSDQLLAGMDDWNKKHHGESGLVDKVKKSKINERDAELEILSFLSNYMEKGTTPLCGNSIGQDRRFLLNYMPELEDFFHYRSIDVSSVKELVKRWYPNLPKFKKKKEHTALEDIRESILELQYYKTNVFTK